MKWRIADIKKSPQEIICNEYLPDIVNSNSQDNNMHSDPRKIDFGCQVYIPFQVNESSKTFVCNRVLSDKYCDAECQTDIMESYAKIITPSRKKYQDKCCGTQKKTFIDSSCGPDQLTEIEEGFHGIRSIKKDEDLLDLAGVTFKNFNFLLRRFEAAKNCKVTKANRLLIFLIKMKTGLTYSAIGVLFGRNRSTISRIFISTLENLACTTVNLVRWPSRDVVRKTMPECFKPDYENTRVIIDCTEFKIEIPSSVDNRVWTYSHYKKGFTALLLVGITPGGFISFKSYVAGGRKSDSQITVESKLIDLLEDGDVVLADKGFPQIQSTIDDSGKEIRLVMPPFLEKQSQFTHEQAAETYNVARVRIHVERIMQRLKTYRILDKIPENLFKHIDDIIHMCCVLVNLQPPIIAD